MDDINIISLSRVETVDDVNGITLEPWTMPMKHCWSRARDDCYSQAGNNVDGTSLEPN